MRTVISAILFPTVIRMNWFSGTSLILLAQDAAEAAGEAAAEQPQITGPAAIILNILPWVLILGFAYLILLRPQSQEAKKREDLLSSLKKDDRVVTIGGIIGTVANISANGKEITLKMDDNSKVRFIRTAIQGKFSSEENEAESKPA